MVSRAAPLISAFVTALRGGTGCAAVLLAAVSAPGTIVTYADFSNATNLSVQGDASIVNAGGSDVLRLTPATTTQSGSAYGVNKVSTTSFSTAFQFRLSSSGGFFDGAQSGGDGFTFIVQNLGVNAVGQTGVDLGIGGITPSLAVEFDTFNNGTIDRNSSNHVGINVNGDTDSVAFANAVTQLDSPGAGTIWSAWIDYNGSTFEVRLSNNGIRPSAALLTHNLNLASSLNSADAFVGFTASTGAAYANHDILNWAYSDVFVNGGISVVPEPSTYALLGTGVGVLGLGYYLRRRRAR